MGLQRVRHDWAHTHKHLNAWFTDEKQAPLWKPGISICPGALDSCSGQCHIPCCPTCLTSMVPSRPTGGLQWRSWTKQNCVQLALKKGLILRSKLFISSSRSRQFPPRWKRNTGLFTGKVWAPLRNSFYPFVQLHMPAPSETMVSAVLLIGLALSGCEQKDRAERHTPTPSTSWLLGLCPGY